MRIAIGSDHAGFALTVKTFLTEEHGNVLDLGTHGADPVDYSDFAEAVGLALRENRADRGILLCGSGVGASMWRRTGFRGFAPDSVMHLFGTSRCRARRHEHAGARRPYRRRGARSRTDRRLCCRSRAMTRSIWRYRDARTHGLVKAAQARRVSGSGRAQPPRAQSAPRS